MSKLPKELKLTPHAQQRLSERKGSEKYNTKNIMKSPYKFYSKEDFISQSSLYIRSLYVCRKAKNKMGYLTDGNIEILYDKAARVAITILELKDKFKPITQYIKPEILKKLEKKKVGKKMKKETNNGLCPDCKRNGVEITSQGICVRCRTRKYNAIAQHKKYVPYAKLSEEEKHKIDKFIEIKQNSKKEVTTSVSTSAPVVTSTFEPVVTSTSTPAPAPVVTPAPINDIVEVAKEPVKKAFDPLSDQLSFIAVLKECGCEIPNDTLKDTLDVLVATDKLKDILMTIVKNDNQQAMLDLEQALNVCERKLQHDWEYNGFQETDDIKFKGFLTWRRMLKSAIFFWKKLYATNTLIEMQKAWHAYTSDPTEKPLLAGDRINSTLKRFQVTTESISTIFNTRRPFTRVFYATSQDEAYKNFLKWMSERQLHEDKSKTTIVELTGDGEYDKNSDN